MKGTILQYDKNNHSGIISGYDGSRYNFVEKDWSSDNRPNIGATVDFEPKDGLAMQIFQTEDSSKTYIKSLAASIISVVLFIMAIGVGHDQDSFVGISILSFIPICLATTSLAKSEKWPGVAWTAIIITCLAYLISLGSLA